ncbi:GNAT family N-acetyltransferase [Endozoicomonas euniceicola]|uniref:GNAT family N-acetyltransferase n=1 Tax=Endozoicomonas euniceicola TaxID=1234143 RepID=A0ABY6GX91_9GAMM|nr:GNAT family N-acetyltransferase [Endozoicomonas euniceicola]UYM16594.1 GNAT family N-acetyltransferase [Endozoicomonas euniceicola]
MPFDCIEFAENTRFYHIPSGNFFILKRELDRDYLTLTLHKEIIGNYKPEAGSVKLTCNITSLLNIKPADSERYKYYAIKNILVLSSYRNISLGVLLMYLATREVRLNGGMHLYLMFPVFRSLGFYIQFGFHPAPEEVAERQFLYADKDRNSKVLFEKEIKEARNYLFWRGPVDIASDLLMRKLKRTFIFKNMI